MGYAVYKVGHRWGGYGVPSVCEHPDCVEEIDRGMAYACGGEPFSEVGCDRYFCGKHLFFMGFNGDNLPEVGGKNVKEVCSRCSKGKPPFEYKPEHKTWVKHLRKDKSWAKWRKANPEELEKLQTN